MKITVIVPTYNESDVIGACLSSLSKQSYKDFDVIVVDDGSIDATVSECQKSKVKCQILTQKHGGAGKGRNLGAKYAKGKILVFVDADMTFDKNFLKNLTKPIVLGKSKGTFSKDEIVSNWNNIWARCWNINEGWEAKKRHPKNYPDTQPVFRAILKKEFEKVGGFTPGGYDDDWSLSQKLGYKAQVARFAVFYHKNPSSLKEVFLHAKWVGKRRYKLGTIGYFIALLRSSFPFSVLIGILKAVRYKLHAFIIFKVVYDMGVFVGILDLLITNKKSK